MLPCLLYVMFILIGAANAAESNKSIEGYQFSLFTECPGSMKPMQISYEMRRYLEIYVSGVKYLRWRRNKYTYHTMGLIGKDTSMDWRRKTIFYIPGWMDNINFPVGTTLTQYFKRIGYNVWILNCLKFQTEEYPIAARALPTIGKHVAEMLANITATQPKFNPKKLHLIGFSIGGQTMSFIAKEYKKLTGLKIDRLTGMDAAGPCFRNRGPEGRIDASDANFVDLIQTNIDGIGMAAPVGHVNFYVNGGEIQPGDFYWMYCGPFCSHSRAYTLMLAAMDHPDSFIAIKCDSVQDARNRKCYDRKPLETNLLGPKADRKKPGIYYLATKAYFPYFMGKDGLKKENDYMMNQVAALNAPDDFVFQ